MVVVTPDNEPFVDLVQVRAEGAFGTGLLVGHGVVLTALHCVCNPDNGWRVRNNVGVYPLRELQEGEERHHDVRIVWPGTDTLGKYPADVAVLRIDESDPPVALVKHRFGELPRAPTMGSARGFPRAAKGPQLPGGRIEHDQPGRVVYTSMTRRALTIDATGRHELEGRERWEGLSGGPLFVNGLIVGVMREVPEGWKGEAVEAEPIAPLLRNPDDASLRKLLSVKLPLIESTDLLRATPAGGFAQNILALAQALAPKRERRIPIVRAIEPSTLTQQLYAQPIFIHGQNLEEVCFVQFSSPQGNTIDARNVISNTNAIRCEVLVGPNDPNGVWDVRLSDAVGGGTETYVPKALTVR